MERNSRISKDLFTLIKNPLTPVFLSVASIWEIIIKRAKGPLRVPKNLMGGIESSGLLVLPIYAPHAVGVEKLPPIHKDPFDRILIAQSKVEKLTLVTSDRKIRKYKTKILKV